MKPFKPLFLSSCALAALAATTALTTGALAQKGVNLSPSTKWSVLDVYDDKKPENSYCAVAKRFKPNAVLTLAKNKKSEASLALDFQSQRFDPTQSFPVTLDPGAGQQRSYEITPASPQALVIRFGQDETFFKALAKTGYLRMVVKDEIMNFDLADIDNGQTELASCLTSLTNPKLAVEENTGGAAVYGVDGKSAATSAGMDIEALKNRIEYLSKENERLSQLAMQAEKLQKAGVSDVQSLKAKEAMLEDLTAGMNALKSENAVLQEKIKTSQDQSQTITKLHNEIKNLKTLNEEISAQVTQPVPVSEVKADNSEQLSILSAEIASLKVENKRLQESLSTAPKGGADAVNTELAAIRKENAALKDQLSKAGKTNSETEKLTAAITSLKQEKEELTAKLAAANSAAPKTETEEIAKIKTDLAALKKENADLKKAAATQEKAQDTIASLQGELESLKASKSEMLDKLVTQTKADVTVSSLGEELAAVKKANLDLKNQLGAAEKRKAEIEELNKKLAALETEKAGLQEKIAEAGKTKTELELLKTELASLKAGNEEMKEKLAAAETAKEKEVSAVKAELKTEKEANEGLKAEIAKYGETDAKIVSLGADVKALQTENAELKEKASGSEEAKTKLVDAEKTLESVKSENESLKTALAGQGETEAKIISLNADLAALKDENAQLKQKLDGVTSVDSKVADAQEAIKNLEEENKQLKDTMASQENAEEKLAALEQEVNALKSENENLKGQIETSKSAESAPPQIPAEIEEKIAMLEQENRELVEEINQARTAVSQAPIAEGPTGEGEGAEVLRQKESEITALKEQLIEKEGQVSGLAAIQEENQRMQDENAEMKVKLGMLSEPEQKIVSLQDRLAGLEKENGDLKTALETAQKKQEQLSAQMAVAKAPPVPKRKESFAEAPHQDNIVATKDNIQKLVEETDPRRTLDEQMAMKEKAEPKAFDEVLNSAAQKQNKSPVSPAAPRGSMTEAQYQEMVMAKALQEEPVAAPPVPSAMPKEVKAEEIVFEDTDSDLSKPSVVREAAEEQEEIVFEDVAAVPPPPEVVRDMSGGGFYAPAFAVQDLLVSAKVADAGHINLVEKASSEQKLAYQWRSGAVYGSAEQKPFAGNGAFDESVKEYLEKTQKRCSGEFAIVPEQSVEFGATRVDSYEIACVGTDVNSSASLLFFNKDNTFTVLTHEATVEHMDATMSLRDRVLQAIKRS